MPTFSAIIKFEDGSRRPKVTQLVSMIVSLLCIVLPDVNVDGNGSCSITVPKLSFFF